jgi:hypothetical protein
MLRTTALIAFALAGCHGARPADTPAPAPAAAFHGHGEVSPSEVADRWADGTWRASELIDPARGLVRYWTETAEVEPARPDVQAHLCGAALTAALAALDAAIAGAARAATEDEMLRCTGDECELAVPGESEPTHLAICRVRAGEPTALVAYLEMPQFTPDADDRQAELRAWSRAELDRPCR